MTPARAIADALAAAHDGKRVLIVSPLLVEARATLGHLERMLATLQVEATVHRANGRERITFASGGSIHITSLGGGSGSMRGGLELDLVYLDDAVLNDDHRVALVPLLAARGGAIVP